MPQSERPRLLLIAPHNSYRIAPYLQAATKLGMDVTIASAGEHSLIAVINQGLHINFADPEVAFAQLKAAASQTPFAAVLGTDDLSVALAARVAEAIGLPHNPPQAATLARRKDKARACLQAAGVAVPEHCRIELGQAIRPQLETLAYPVVLKPLAMSGSRGVIRVDDLDSAEQAVTRIKAILRQVDDLKEAAAIQAEAFIEGREVAYEGLLEEGQLRTLVLFDKPDPLNGPYFEETYYIAPSRLSGALQMAVTATVAAACRAYGLRQGPVHAELRIDRHNKVWVIEVAARTIGGECARLVELATGYPLEEVVLAQLLGKRLAEAEFTGGAGVLMIPIPAAGILRRVEGTLAAQSVPGIEALVISVRDGHELVPLPEGSSYLGFIYAVAETAEQAERALRQAHSELEIVTAPLFKLQAMPS